MFGEYTFANNNLKYNSSEKISNNQVEVFYKGVFFGIDEIKIDIFLTNKNDYSMLLNGLKGQYALAIYQPIENKLTIARDHFGTVPLYYYIDDKKFIFGTNIKNIISKINNEFIINENVLHEYLVYRYVSGNNTFYKDIYELHPGSTLQVDIHGNKIYNHFYDPYKEIKITNKNKNIELFEDYFLNSYKEQSFDLNVKKCGILSSGGIDSSILVSSSKSVNLFNFSTYYMGNENYDYNKNLLADRLSELHNIKHKNIFISGEEFSNNLIETISINEEPLNHPSSVLRYYLNKKIQNEVDVLLSGEGADCLFCGYYVFNLIYYFYVNNPLLFATRFFSKLFPYAISPVEYRSRFKKLIDVFIYEPHIYTLNYSGFNSSCLEDVESFLVNKTNKKYIENYKNKFKKYSKNNILDIILILFQGDYLVEALNTIYKIGAHTNVDFRHPFIDIDLVRYFNELPWNEKIHFFKRKYQVNKLAKKVLPHDFLNKRKEGFGVPLGKWFYEKNALARYIELLSDTKTNQRGVFDPHRISHLKDLYFNKKLTSDSFETILWPIINLELWFRIFVDQDVNGYT